MITFQKQKANEETKLVQELKITKELLIKAHKDLEIKTDALDAELQKVKGSEASKETFPKINEAPNVKEKESGGTMKEKQKAIQIPCKYFHKIKGCRRGNKCWFIHDDNHKAEQNIKHKHNQTKKFKEEPKIENQLKQVFLEESTNLQEIALELLKLLLRGKNI